MALLVCAGCWPEKVHIREIAGRESTTKSGELLLTLIAERIQEYERGEVQTQMSMVPSHRFIIIDDDRPEIGHTISSKARNVKVMLPTAEAQDNTVKVKQEPVDSDTEDVDDHSRKPHRHVAITQERIDVDELEDQ